MALALVYFLLYYKKKRKIDKVKFYLFFVFNNLREKSKEREREKDTQQFEKYNKE